MLFSFRKFGDGNRSMKYYGYLLKIEKKKSKKKFIFMEYKSSQTLSKKSCQKFSFFRVQKS